MGREKGRRKKKESTRREKRQKSGNTNGGAVDEGGGGLHPHCRRAFQTVSEAITLRQTGACLGVDWGGKKTMLQDENTSASIDVHERRDTRE